MTQQSTPQQAVSPCQVLNGEGVGRTTVVPTEIQQAAAARSLPFRHIRIRAFITADNDGTHSAVVDHPDKAKDQWGYKYRIEVEDIKKLVDGANKAFSAAGIQFHFDPPADVEIRHETLLNRDSVPPEGSTSWARNRLAKEHRGTLVVFFRYGWQGWSNSVDDFVIMPSIWESKPKGLSFLAHELRHYFHLDHTFVDIGGIPSAALTIKNYVEEMAKAQHNGQLPKVIPDALINKGLEVLDYDRAAVSDTPPELLWGMFKDVCDPNESMVKVPVTFATGQTKTYPSQPDRDNIMNYTEKDCRGIPPHFSTQQLARMRNAVDAGNRKHLWQPVRVGPTPFSACAVASNGDVHLFALDRHDGLSHTVRRGQRRLAVPLGRCAASDPRPGPPRRRPHQVRGLVRRRQ